MNEPITAAAWHRLLSDVTGQEVPGLDLDADLVRELGLDSLARLRLLAGVEKHFHVRLPDARLADLRSLRQLADALAEAQAQKITPNPAEDRGPHPLLFRHEPADPPANSPAKQPSTVLSEPSLNLKLPPL